MKSFEMGRMVMTNGVAAKLDADHTFRDHVIRSLARYAARDWGDLDPDDAEMNELALKNNDDRILAAYTHPAGADYKIWILTEWDRSATTILFPDEY